MHSNQRARLVLHPVVLISVLVIAGCAIGLGIVWRRGSVSAGAREHGTAGTPATAGLQLSSNHLDFGDVGLARSVSRQLRLGNNGSDPIALRIEGGDAFLVNPRRLTVQPQTAARVTVTAKPTKLGAIQDQLRVFRDGASEPLLVSLEANGSADATAAGSISDSGPEAEQAGDTLASGGPAGSAEVYPLGGSSAPSTGADGSQPVGSVQISRTVAERGGDDSETGSASADGRIASASAAGATVVPSFDTAPRGPRSMSDRPTGLPTGAPPADGEDAVDISHKNPHDADELAQDDGPGNGDDDSALPAAFVVASSSSLSLMGTMNRFYPQQIGVSGSGSGGSFSLITGIQFPKIPLAFGQSMSFAQNGAATGQFDRSSGQITLNLLLNATDSNGRTAPMPITLTTGSVVTRNTSGVLISLNGQPRVGASGQLRLVGIQKIPLSYGNSAEQQLVMVDIVASLGFGASPQGQ